MDIQDRQRRGVQVGQSLIREARPGSSTICSVSFRGGLRKRAETAPRDRMYTPGFPLSRSNRTHARFDGGTRLTGRVLFKSALCSGFVCLRS